MRECVSECALAGGGTLLVFAVCCLWFQLAALRFQTRLLPLLLAARPSNTNVQPRVSYTARGGCGCCGCRGGVGVVRYVQTGAFAGPPDEEKPRFIRVPDREWVGLFVDLCFRSTRSIMLAKSADGLAG